MFVGYFGHVEATDEQSAIEAAAKEFNVPEALRDRIVARREVTAANGPARQHPLFPWY